VCLAGVRVLLQGQVSPAELEADQHHEADRGAQAHAHPEAGARADAHQRSMLRRHHVRMPVPGQSPWVLLGPQGRVRVHLSRWECDIMRS
jgi:hypothetical protein